MTIEIAEFKCPSCGHLLGEEEYRHACNEFNQKVQVTSDEQIDKIRVLYEEKMYKQQQMHTLELQEEEEKHRMGFEKRVNQQVQSQTKMLLSEQEEKLRTEMGLLTEKYEQEIKKKNEEIRTAELQSDMYVDEKIEEAVAFKEEKHRQRETEFNLQISRIQKQNGGLADQVERLQQTLENVPPEFRGTTGEIMLFDELHSAFPQDKLIPKTVGVEMPDVVQTVVVESGESIDTPILWDMKVGENVTAKDIEKAIRYKEKYNTDYCIVVTAKGITAKDSKNFRTGLIGKREGVLLVHSKIAVGIAELTRNFLIEKTRLMTNNNGRASKQVKLYEYITSSARFRKMQEKIEKKLKLNELQRKEEARTKKTWNERKMLIQDWFELDKEDEEFINSITQEEESDISMQDKGDG